MPENNLDITFFIPCFNEENNVVPTIETIQKAMQNRPISYEILVFDDGSTDRSVQNVEEFLRKYAQAPVRFMRNERNVGLGTNYLKGSFIAKGHYYMMVCGDNDTPLSTLNYMIDQLKKADIVVPYLENIDARPFGRRFFSKLFTWLVGFISGSRLKYYNGIVLHLTSTVKRFTPSTTGFAYQAEILCQAIAGGLSFLEVPIQTVPQSSFLNTSAFRLKNVISVVGSLWRILWGRKYHCSSETRRNMANNTCP